MFNAEELAGQFFGLLEVLFYEDSIKGGSGGRMFLCRCKCGVEKLFSGNRLKSGRHKSCGCKGFGNYGDSSFVTPHSRLKRQKEIATIGEVWGKLTILDLYISETVTGKGSLRLCKCECGVEKILGYSKLKNGDVKSCGCLKYKRGLKYPYKPNTSHDYVSVVLKTREVKRSKNLKRIGLVFNRLTITDVVFPEKGKSIYVCRCSCDKIYKLNRFCRLVRGDVKSCGCLAKEVSSKTASKLSTYNNKIGRIHIYTKNGVSFKMRSSYEFAFANYLTSEGIEWEYEPKLFVLKEGCRYKPDFYVPATNEWYEVKGYIDEKSKEKIDLFREQGHIIIVVDQEYIKRVTGLKYGVINGVSGFYPRKRKIKHET